MREEEARTKWCPHVRVGGVTVTFNRDTQGMHNADQYQDTFNCIGSKCMMWESWEYEKGDHHTEKRNLVVEGDCGLKAKPNE